MRCQKCNNQPNDCQRFVNTSAHVVRLLILLLTQSNFVMHRSETCICNVPVRMPKSTAT
jgi:hypothetical protein